MRSGPPLPMVDLHAHILPGIDDGPASMGESIELARALAADGVGTVAATPHLRDDHPAVVPQELAGRCKELRAALAAEGVPLDVVPGGEVDLLWAGRASDTELRLASYGQRGGHLLVETPYTPLPRHFEQLLFELEVRGFGLVLAHPERNNGFQAEPERAARLAQRGTLLQVTASSLLEPSSASGRAARALVAGGHAYLIASDVHGLGRHRRVALSEGERAAAELAPGRSSWMVREGPAAVLAGEVPEPPPDGAQRGWRRFLGLDAVRRRT